MAYALGSDKFHLITKELKDLKWDLLGTVCAEAHAQLLLYQQGKSRRTAKANKIKKLPTSTTMVGKQAPVPSEQVLNDIKLDKELDALRNIFEQAFEAITKACSDEEASYANVVKAIENQNQNNNEEDALSQELKENKNTLQQLGEVLQQEQKEFSKKIAEKSQRVRDLREQVENLKRVNRLEIRLVEKWENNRLSQATIMGEKRERQLMQEIGDLHRRMAEEQRLICEIETFRENEISELKKQIAEWEKKFALEKSEITAKNLALMQNIADVVKSHEKHREITEERQKFVEEYLRKKAEEERLLEAQRYRIACAVCIQAWWRGVMVRQGLGPYRKKSKKGKKSKSKK